MIFQLLLSAGTEKHLTGDMFWSKINPFVTVPFLIKD